MSKRLTKAARSFLIAAVRGEVCGHCHAAPGSRFGMHTECGPCAVKRIDRAYVVAAKCSECLMVG